MKKYLALIVVFIVIVVASFLATWAICKSLYGSDPQAERYGTYRIQTDRERNIALHSYYCGYLASDLDGGKADQYAKDKFKSLNCKDLEHDLQVTK